jgi:hypothetical protein
MLRWVRKMSIFPQMEKYSLHNFTDNGFQLIQFAVLRNMIIGPTFYPHKDIHTSTWTSPDGVTFNQINHLLIDRKHKSNLMDVRSFPDTNNDSDHCLVIAHLRDQISDVKKVVGIRTSKYNVPKLTASEVAEQYRQQIEEKQNSIVLIEQDNGEKLLERCKTIINSVAEEVLGIMEPVNKGTWYVAECQAATEDKNKAHRKTQKGYDTRSLTEGYMEKRMKEKNS